MGYQESMIPIGCLAEAEGIKDGIESYRRVHGCGLFYYCAASERYTGQLYACVGGDRYQIGRASCRERVCQYV